MQLYYKMSFGTNQYYCRDLYIMQSYIASTWTILETFVFGLGLLFHTEELPLFSTILSRLQIMSLCRNSSRSDRGQHRHLRRGGKNKKTHAFTVVATNGDHVCVSNPTKETGGYRRKNGETRTHAPSPSNT